MKADYEIHIANKIRAIAIRFRALCIEVRAEVAILVKASAEPERVGYTTYLAPGLDSGLLSPER